MKKFLLSLFSIVLCLSLVGCGIVEVKNSKSNTSKDEINIKNTITGNMETYTEMSDGTWKCGNRTYKYRLEISGRMPNAETDTTFIYLSNIENISFEKAYLASGISSNINDYFSPEEAILVEMH